MQHLNFSVLLDVCLWTLLVAAPLPFRVPSGKIKNLEFLLYALIGICCAGLMEFSKKFCFGQQPLQPVVTRANENTLRMALRIPSIWCCPQCPGKSLATGNDIIERFLLVVMSGSAIFIIMQTIIQMPRLNQYRALPYMGALTFWCT